MTPARGGGEQASGHGQVMGSGAGGNPVRPDERTGGDTAGKLAWCLCLLPACSAPSSGGRCPATVILETEHLIAFLDHRPLFRGHTLLVPKAHLRLRRDLPAGPGAEFLTTAQRLERAVEDGLGAAGSMILVNNVVSQSVPHLHLHVIPRNPRTACGSGSGRGTRTTTSTRRGSTPRRSGQPCLTNSA